VSLLQNAGHNVIRFNGPDAQATLLTDAEIAAMNTNDLVIIGRASGSGAWRAPQGSQWNVSITKPLICMSPYLVRTLAGAENRMAWFTAATLPDDTTTKVKAVSVTDPKADFLLAEVPMEGDTSTGPFDEILDRNTSHISDPPVAGGRSIITGTFIREDNGALATCSIVAEFPAGTAVLGGPLAGYRMYLSGGSRESGSVPNAIPLYTGRETLTPAGERLFLRAVQLAINNGTPPAVDPSTPVAILSGPSNITVVQGGTVTFTASVSGAAPRTLKWQRDTGGNFVDIQDATTPFATSSYTFIATNLADTGSRFRLVASNPNNSVDSTPATLTIIPDQGPPGLVSAASIDGNTIGVTFDELLDTAGGAFSPTIDPFNYIITAPDAPGVSTVALRQDGKSVLLTLSGPIGPNFKLKVINVADQFGNALSETGVEIDGVSLGLNAIAVGALNPAGFAFAQGAGAFEVTGGGLDLGSTTDQMEFVNKTMTGDFDARVRVLSITGSNRVECVTKAILSARATADTGSGAVNVFATIGFPGDDLIASSVRASAGGATNVLGAPFSPVNLPNTWLRIRRLGDVFTTMRSTDGASWTEIGSASVPLGPSVLIGAGVASHRNTWFATAKFSDFKASAIINSPTLAGLAFNGTTFTGTLTTQAGATYNIQYKNNLTDEFWTTFATLNGDGTVQTFTDTHPNADNRFYRAIANP